MFHANVEAEKAAMEGRRQDFDTQQCLSLQDQILSSNPHQNHQDASREVGSGEGEGEGKAHSHLSEKRRLRTRPDTEIDASLQRDSEAPAVDDTRPPSGDPPPDSTTADTNIGPSLYKRHLTSLQNSNEELRKIVLERSRSTRSERERNPADMEGNLTQDSISMSAMSPTQENTQSAYQQYNVGVQALPSGAVVDGSDQVDEDTGIQDPQSVRQYHSAITDSTAHTYEENDTGHVGFDILPVIDGSAEPEEEVMSQDESFAPRLRQEENSYPQYYEPQTPAPPNNPFTNRGSVMKGHEMFGATQPSSIGRYMASATSSRPSPDVYNDFTSPAKRMQSSPLPGYLDESGTPLLQSSVRDLLRAQLNDSPLQVIPRMSGVQSFDSGPRIQPHNKVREGRPYVSVHESQEQRKGKRPSPDSGSETENSDYDAPRKRFLKKQREEQIQKQLSGIVIQKRAAPAIPASSSPGIVEVPSTGRRGRRRSTQEDYVAQCEGHDARDTQPDDVIVDSQSVPTEQQPAEPATLDPNGQSLSWPGSRSTDRTDRPSLPNLPVYHTAEHNIPELDQNSTPDGVSSPPKDPGSPLQQPSLPLQEVSTNCSDLRTPVASKLYSDAAVTTVPETSPAEDRILPLGEIASISFSNETQQNHLSDLPGFSQRDSEFEDALRIGADPSPDPTPKRTRAPRIPRFPAPDKATEPIKPSGGSSKHSATSKLPMEETEVPVAQTSVEDSVVSLDCNKTIKTAHENAVLEDETQDNTQNENTGIKIEAHRRTEVVTIEKSNEADPQVLSKSPEATSNRTTLRSKDQLKGPSQALRRNAAKPALKTYVTPRQSAGVTKASSTGNPRSGRSSRRATVPLKLMSTPLSSRTSLPSPSLQSSPVKSVRKSARNSLTTREEPPIPSSARPASTRRSGASVKSPGISTPAPAPARSSTKRKSASGTEKAAVDPVQPTRSSKRQSMPMASRNGSVDPLAGSGPSITDALQANGSGGLFANMSFAVSYVNQDEEKNKVMRMIKSQGGQILADGFDSLFDLRRALVEDGDGQLTLSHAATRVGFAALIADEHSRKAKYMQALALGLPCISWRWVTTCASKAQLVNWAPYLLCAGQSAFLGNALRSRTLQPYDAATANFPDIFASRGKILDGRSILLVEGKGRASEEKRKAYSFLAQAAGPGRFGKVADLEQARVKLLDSEKGGHAWDLLYVDHDEAAAESIVFGGSIPAASGSKKRKRVQVAAGEKGTPAPKKIRIISDETVIQSLILGQLLEE